MMKTTLVLLGVAATLSPLTAVAKPPTFVAPAPTLYRAHYGMTYSAAEAKKDHYICPMDHMKMVSILPPQGYVKE